MPELCRFGGIVIRMYVGDHAPPHFHAEYAEHEMQMSIQHRRVMNGDLPPRQARLVIRWATERETELMEAWERASNDEPPGTVEPL